MDECPIFSSESRYERTTLEPYAEAFEDRPVSASRGMPYWGTRTSIRLKPRVPEKSQRQRKRDQEKNVPHNARSMF
jgi:hypothetical protein